MKITMIALLITSLMACGGGGGGSSDKQVQDPDPVPDPDPVQYTKFNDLVGIWDASATYDGVLDVNYAVIKDDSSLVSYDYLGDEYDQVANCYEVNTLVGKLVDLGLSQFNILVEDLVFEEVFTYSSNDISLYTMPDVNTVEIKAISSDISIAYNDIIVYSHKIEVIDKNNVTFIIFEGKLDIDEQYIDEQYFTATLSRQSRADEWNVDSGFYTDLDFLYSEATSVTQVTTSIRSEYSESDFTPLCRDLQQATPKYKNIPTMSNIENHFDSLGNYLN